MFPRMGKPYLPNQAKSPVIVYTAFHIEGVRVRSIIIYLTVGITACSPVMEMFYVHKWDSQRRIPHTHTLSLTVPLSPRPSHNETNRPALSEMHYYCAYLSALQWIMLNFYSEQCCDMGTLHFANEPQPAVCSKWWSTVQGNWSFFFFCLLFCSRYACGICCSVIHDTEQKAHSAVKILWLLSVEGKR